MTATSPAQSRYRLADHVRACHVDGQVILLDLNRSKYIGVGGPMLPDIAAIVIDWPGRTADSIRHSRLIADSPQVAALARQGLLVNAFSAPPPSTQLDTPLDTVREAHGLVLPVAGLRGLVNMGTSAFVTARWLKRLSFASIAETVIRLRPEGLHAGDTRSQGDLECVVSGYLRMRPLVMTSHDKCLHDSLTLVRFLARLGHYPRWVVGVRTRPFAAHSWVQAGSLVLNDVHERVRGYTPILVV